MLFILQTAPFSGANIGVCWPRAHALGAERDIEVNISDKTFEQKGAKKHFIIYNDSCLQTIDMGWWSKFESAHGLSSPHPPTHPRWHPYPNFFFKPIIDRNQLLLCTGVAERSARAALIVGSCCTDRRLVLH